MNRSRLRVLVTLGIAAVLAAVGACNGESSSLFGGGSTGGSGNGTGQSGGQGGTEPDAGPGGSSAGGSGAFGGGGTGGGTTNPDAGPQCPNPVGHDEDEDSRDDACDNCPTYPNPDQTDGDLDGLGDACEAPGNAGLLSAVGGFDSFWLDADGWTAMSESWEHISDAFKGSSSPTGSNAYYDMSVVAPYAAETTFTYLDDGTNGENYAGVLFAAHYNPEHGGANVWWLCAYERDSGDLSAWAVEWNVYQYQIVWQAQVDDVDSTGSDTGVWRRIRAIHDGYRVDCTFENGAGDYAVLPLESDDIWDDMSGDMGVRVYNETAAFQSFVVYE